MAAILPTGDDSPERESAPLTEANVTPDVERTASDPSLNWFVVTMYTTDWCGYCVRLKRGLDEAGISYREVNIERDEDAALRVMQVNGGNQTVPTLEFADGSALTNPSVRDVAHRLASLN